MRNWRKRGVHITAAAALAICLAGGPRLMAAAESSVYTTYLYSNEGIMVHSPDAYEFGAEYSGTDLGAGALSDPTHICTDDFGRILVSDSGNGRVLVLDENFKLITELTGFNAPHSTCVAPDGHIYVADSGNARLVEYDENYEQVRVVGAPQSDILGSNYAYKPIYVSVDSAGRIYVMSQNENQGILELSSEGEFIGYYGAQKVQNNIFDWFKANFMTLEQRSRLQSIIPRTYNCMVIDRNDFIWVTSNSLDADSRYSYMTSKSSENAVVKRLNPNGNDVLSRFGTFAPGGDLTTSPSSITGVAVRDNGIYTLLDGKYNKLFTYNEDGDLLYAFGGTGSQDGVTTLAVSIAYLGNDLLVLDGVDGTVTRYCMTEYGHTLDLAIEADQSRDFELSSQYWDQIQRMNHNLDLAYGAMGNNYMRNGLYRQAMDNYRLANDPGGYSRAFRFVRVDFVKAHFLPVLAVPLLALALWLWFRKKVNEQNKKLYPVGSKHTLGDELCFAFRVIYHPFDGFWDLKHEGRGSIRSATVILLMVLATTWYQAMGTAYLFRDVPLENVVIMENLLNVLLPFGLWCLVSWGLTTFLGGEGSIKDIYIMSAYSLFPLILTGIPATLLSNVLALEEAQLMTFFLQLGYVWMVALMFAGSMVIHDYRFMKNVWNVVFTMVGMAAVMFLALLFVTLGQNIIEFLAGIFEEVVFRL